MNDASDTNAAAVHTHAETEVFTSFLALRRSKQDVSTCRNLLTAKLKTTWCDFTM